MQLLGGLLGCATSRSTQSAPPTAEHVGAAASLPLDADFCSVALNHHFSTPPMTSSVLGQPSPVVRLNPAFGLVLVRRKAALLTANPCSLPAGKMMHSGIGHWDSDACMLRVRVQPPGSIAGWICSSDIEPLAANPNPNPNQDALGQENSLTHAMLLTIHQRCKTVSIHSGTHYARSSTAVGSNVREAREICGFLFVPCAEIQRFQ